ncbi:hypothetical protein [Paracoccus pacificus]|uniref:EamA-like transporter family protein n=1 Tax=Paracoccus pacificus TaxID=1463598 RepID=A0ABW4R3M2_9RHOB
MVAQNTVAQETSTARMLALLMVTGGLLAVTLIFAKLASDAGIPMLWYQAVVTGIAGAVQLGIAALTGQIRGDARHLTLYAAGAGAFQATPSGMAYLAIGHVGAGYVSLSFAFPILLTWVIARLLGMERPSTTRLIAVLLGLGGGILLAVAKFSGAPGGTRAWILVATLIPVVLAMGNIYRSRFWPHGAPAVLLAGMMLVACAGWSAIAAYASEGPMPVAIFTDRLWLLLTLGNAATFAVQFVTYFMLQRAGGPVALSLIGSVAGVIGAAVAISWFGETMPVTTPVAAVMIAIGIALMLRSQKAAVV